MKILEVASAVPGRRGSGGAEVFMRQLSVRLANSHHQVKIIVPPDPLVRTGGKLLRKVFFDYFSPANQLIFGKILQNFRPDIVHFHNFYGIGSSLARVASRYFPTVITAHDYWPFCYYSTLTSGGRPCPVCLRRGISRPADILHRLHTPLNHFLLGNCHFVAPSRFLAAKLATLGRFKNISHIQNGISPPPKITDYSRRLLWVGRLSPEKGLPAVIPVLADFQKASGWQVTIVGDGPLKPDLSRRYPQIEFTGYTDPTPYYRRSSVLVFSSIWPENQPYSLMEAMSFGLVPLAAGVGGVPEIITAGKTGFLYDPADPAALHRRLAELISNPETIKKIGKSATISIARNFSWDRTLSEYTALFQNLLRH